MKLTKGKISKLYNKHRQSCRRKKICKRRKNNQSFRKMKPLNLATKTLKMKGGISKMGTYFNKKRTGAAELASSKYNNLKGKLTNKLSQMPSVLSSAPTEAFNILVDFKSTGKDWYIRSKRGVYQTEESIRNKINDLNKGVKNLIFTDILFSEFTNATMYKQVMISMYEFENIYAARYVDKKDANEDGEQKLFDVSFNNVYFFKELYICLDYKKYCEKMDIYVNDAKSKEIHDFFKRKLVDFAPDLNQGFLTICNNNIRQLEFAMKKKEDLTIEVVKFQKSGGDTQKLVEDDIKKLATNPVFFKSILKFFLPATAVPATADRAPTYYRAYYDLIYDNKKKYNTFVLVLNNKLKRSLNDAVFQILLSALNKMGNLNQSYLEQAKQSILSLTSEGRKFYARQTTFQNNIRAFEETTADKLLIDKNNTAVKSLQDKLVMNKLATEKNGGDGETKLVQAEMKTDMKDVQAEMKTGGDGEADAINPTKIIECLNKMDTTSESDNGSEFDPPTITGNFLLDIEQCITFEDYTYVLMEYSKKLDNRILVLWIKYLDSYKPDLNTAYYNEYKKVLDDLKYKLYVKQNPGFMSRFLTQINGENDEELKFVESQLDNDRKVKEWNSNKDQKADKKSDNAIKELKKVTIGEDKIFDDLLGLHDTVDKVMTTNGGAASTADTKYKVLNDIYTNYTKQIDYYASTLNKNQIRDARKALSKLKDVLNTGYYDELMNDLNKIEEKNTNPGMIEDVRGEKLLRKTSFFDEIYNAKPDDAKTKLVVEEYSVRLKCEDFKNYDSLIKTEFDARKIDYNDYKMLKTAIDALKTKINCQNVMASSGIPSATSQPSDYEKRLDERIKSLENFIKNQENQENLENINDSAAPFSSLLSKIQEPYQTTVSNTTTTTVSPQISPDQRSIINISLGTQGQDNINDLSNRLKQLESEREKTKQLLAIAPSTNISQVEDLKKQLDAQNATIEKQQNSIDAATQATKDSEQKVTEASNKLVEAQKAAETAQKEAVAKTTEHETAVTEIKTNADKTADENQKKIDGLQAAADQAQEQVKTAETEKDVLKIEIKSKTEEIEKLTEQGTTESALAKKTLDDQLDAMQVKLAAATEEATKKEELFVKQKTEFEKQRDDLEQSLKSATDKIEQATAAVTAEKNAAIAKAAEAEKLKEAAAAALNLVQSQHADEINMLKLEHETRMATNQKELEEKTSELKKAQNEIESTKVNLGQKQEELDKQQTELQKQLEQEQANFTAQQAAIKSSDLSTAEQATMLLDANKSVEDLKAKLAENAKQLDSITETNNVLKTKQTELDAEMVSLKSEKNKLAGELDKSKLENDLLKPHLVIQLEGTPEYGAIINGILTSIRGGGDDDITLTSHTKASDFLAGIVNPEIKISLDSCKSSSSVKDVTQLKGQMKLFKDLINKVIYGTPVLLMLNSLSFEEYDKLKLTINQGNDQTNISIKGLVDYMVNFTNFIFIDTTQIYEFSGDYNGPYMITNSAEPSEFVSVQPNLGNTYASLNAICNKIGLPKQSDYIMNNRKTNLSNVLAMPSDDPNDLTFNYKENLKVTHILELISYFDELINLDDALFKNRFADNDLYAFINSFMYGRMTKLNDLIESVATIESCNADCAESAVNCDAKPCKMSLNSFKRTLSELTYERKPVSTYLILNNRGEGDIYNHNRFGLATDYATRYLQVRYNDDDKKASKDPQLDPTQNGGTYGKTYLFGEFDKIYGLRLPQAQAQTETKQTRNEFIASDLLKIQSQLLEGKLVFLFGYGQSGAGKTSTLIYFKDPLKDETQKGEQGVLVHLCNLFGKGTYKTTPDVKPVTKYTKLKLITQEFYSSDNDAVGKCDGVANNDKCKEQTFDFTFEKDQFVLPSKGTVSTSVPNKKKFSYRHNLKEQGFFGDRSFGGVLQYLIDKDRFVKPTTNNPDSSRSHSLIYIVLSDANGTKLRIGLADLAGVEPKFKCDEQDVIKAFLELNKERESKDNSSYVPGETRTYGKSIDPEFSLSRNDVDELLGKQIVYTNGAFEDVGDEQVIKAIDTFDKRLTKFFEDGGEVPTFGEISNANSNNINIYETQKNAYKAISDALSGGKNGGGNRKTRKITRKTKGKTRKIVQSGGETPLDILKTALAGINPKAAGKDIQTALVQFKAALPTSGGPGLTNAIATWIMDKVDNDINFKNFSQMFDSNLASWLEYKAFVKKIQDAKTVEELLALFGSKPTQNQKIMIARKIQKLIGLMPNKYENAKTIMKYGKDICNERTSEGNFINKTLTELRENIFEIMIKKTKQWIYYSPSFHYECLSDLCPTDRNCFSIKSTEKEPTEPKSLIIKWLFEKDKSNNDNSSYDNFCSNIQIGLFGVFNISTQSNNPPPVSYIDINDLKKMWNKMNDTNYGNDNTKLTEDTTKINEFIKAVSTYIGVAERKVEQSIKDLTKKVVAFEQKQLDYNGTTLTGPYRTLIDEFIKLIEINNSTTAIGTLEYLDSFAKLNTTDTVCSKPQGTFANITKSIQ